MKKVLSMVMLVAAVAMVGCGNCNKKAAAEAETQEACAKVENCEKAGEACETCEEKAAVEAEAAPAAEEAAAPAEAAK